MEVILAGPDPEPVGDAIEAAGGTVTVLEGVPAAASLKAAGVEHADVLVLTDASLATAVPVALEVNAELRTVIYDERTAPAFVQGQLDLSVDPRLVDSEALATALLEA